MLGRRAVSLGVNRKKERNGVVGACPDEARNGRGERFEVQVAYRGRQPGQRSGYVPVNHGPIFLHGLANDALQVAERIIRRNVPDFFYARFLQLPAAVASQPGQFADAVIGPDEIPRAMRVIRAVVRSEAVISWRHLRSGTRPEHGQHVPDPSTYGFLKRVGLVRERMSSEQRIEIEPDAVINVVPVERDHLHFANVKAGAAQHPELDGHIENEDVLEPGGGFDFTQPPAAAGQTFEDVDPDKYALVPEGGLEERRRRSRPEDLASFLDRLADMPIVVPDRMPARMALAREFADLVAGIEYRLKGIVGRWRQVTLVTVVPEPEVALIAGKVTGFGEAGHQQVHGLSGAVMPKATPSVRISAGPA